MQPCTILNVGNEAATMHIHVNEMSSTQTVDCKGMLSPDFI